MAATKREAKAWGATTAAAPRSRFTSPSSTTAGTAIADQVRVTWPAPASSLALGPMHWLSGLIRGSPVREEYLACVYGRRPQSRTRMHFWPRNHQCSRLFRPKLTALGDAIDTAARLEDGWRIHGLLTDCGTGSRRLLSSHRVAQDYVTHRVVFSCAATSTNIASSA